MPYVKQKKFGEESATRAADLQAQLLRSENNMVTQDILKKPIVTEKTTLLQDRRTYVFEVSSLATKPEIKEAIELAFDVNVLSVNTMHVKGKVKRFGPRQSQRRSWKKAIVTLAQGESITIFEGV